MVVVDVLPCNFKLSLDDEVQVGELVVLLGKDLTAGESTLLEVGLISGDFGVSHP